MVSLAFVRLVQPRRLRIAQVFDVSEDVAIRILRPRRPPMRAQTEVRHRALQTGPALDRQAPNQHEAAAGLHLVQHPCQTRPERRQRKVLLAEGHKINFGIDHALDRAIRCPFDLRDFVIRKKLDPFAPLIQVGAVPCRWSLDFGREFIH